MFTVFPAQALQEMEATRSEWPDYQSWMRARKKRKDPMTLGEIAEEGGVAFALQAARVLPDSTEQDARRLAAAIVMGDDGRLAEAFRQKSKGKKFVDDVLDAVIRYADGSISLEELKKAVHGASANIADLKNNDIAADILTAACSAGAFYWWGGAALAYQYSSDAARLLAKEEAARELKRSGAVLSKEDTKRVIDAAEAEAHKASERYATFLIRHLFG